MALYKSDYYMFILLYVFVTVNKISQLLMNKGFNFSAVYCITKECKDGIKHYFRQYCISASMIDVYVVNTLLIASHSKDLIQMNKFLHYLESHMLLH